MDRSERYTVSTQYGCFSLDEASYRDYLEGNLWICGPKKKTRPAVPPRPQVSERALELREQAGRRGLKAVLQEVFPQEVLTPYVPRLAGVGILEMSLSVRSSNGLLRSRVDTFGRLQELLESEGGVRSVRNLGATSEREIREHFMEECYLRLEDYEQAHYWQKLLDNAGEKR